MIHRTLGSLDNEDPGLCADCGNPMMAGAGKAEYSGMPDSVLTAFGELTPLVEAIPELRAWAVRAPHSHALDRLTIGAMRDQERPSMTLQ